MIHLNPETLSPEDVPLCPLCDQPIWNYEQAAVISSGDAKCMAHQDCTEEALADEEHPND